MTRHRLAFVVSHPIQYYVPLYAWLARHGGMELKVFYTWHAATAPVRDRGFGHPVAWDIPLTEGYEHEAVPNTARDPGTHHFFGLRNPGLARRVLAWRPDAVHVTGWAWLSHLLLLRDLAHRRVPTLFRGDSHLLDSDRAGPGAHAKAIVRRHVFRWPTRFLYTGAANRQYYLAHGVEEARLCRCPHSIDVERFAEPSAGHEAEARRWRAELGIDADRVVLLYAGKFEARKRPVELMRAVLGLADPRFLLIMAGAGEMNEGVRQLAAQAPERFRVLPFQNQSRMPALYRLGDIFVLPSAYGETWGLAVNEAMASGRPVVVSDRVGCAADVVDDSCGRVFPREDWAAMATVVADMAADRSTLERMARAAAIRARQFDIPATAQSLRACLEGALAR